MDDEAALRLGIPDHHLGPHFGGHHRGMGVRVNVRFLESEMLNKHLRPYISVLLRVPSLFVIDLMLSETFHLGFMQEYFPWITTILLFYGEYLVLYLTVA